jgi:hypothetical protein
LLVAEISVALIALRQTFVRAIQSAGQPESASKAKKVPPIALSVAPKSRDWTGSAA